MELVFTPAALKSLRPMSKHDAEALLGKLKQFAASPFTSHSFAKALTGGGTRVRHGDWRAVCVVDGKTVTVTVVKIGNRKEVYK
ncbi:MAG TPA: type II toxin-antitoxin system RelE/ParE family toxin [Aliidongia sp.]|uniref:type II toxin-antitoxin system RelE family toxin n=1 Tax=Aliidongia sp. TaxID=1914230 RepID=UPI002DDD0C45|nr:type II toxin-antitoxin system RelE/ParE family toxin [Aliidongia sp.]HEV2674483.1 type II toxin-antitoxin system RelE/ParE family toxin [Aliidongia sp.]